MTASATALFLVVAVAGAFARGVATGVVVSLPTGPVNVAVIRSGITTSVKMGIAVGAGAAVVDALYSLLAYMGLAPLVRAVPWVDPVLAGVGCILMTAYGALCVYRPVLRSSDARRAEQSYKRAFALGALMTLANPGPLLAWIPVASATMVGLTTGQAFIFSLGVLGGGVAWFAVLATLANRGTMKVGSHATLITRAMGVALLGFGIYLGYRCGTKVVALLT